MPWGQGVSPTLEPPSQQGTGSRVQVQPHSQGLPPPQLVAMGLRLLKQVSEGKWGMMPLATLPAKGSASPEWGWRAAGPTARFVPCPQLSQPPRRDSSPGAGAGRLLAAWQGRLRLSRGTQGRQCWLAVTICPRGGDGQPPARQVQGCARPPLGAWPGGFLVFGEAFHTPSESTT